MMHQPYEEWIFIDSSRENGSLTRAQRIELQKHLENCLSCRTLFDAWTDVEQDLGRTLDINPDSGFSRRWLDLLEIQHAGQFKRTIKRLFAFSGAGSLILFVFLVIIGSSWIVSPASQIWNTIIYFRPFYSFFEAIFRYAVVIFGTVLRTIPLSWFLLFAGVSSELIVIWFLFYRIITSPRRLVL